jgi:hypothetical protein
LRDFTGTRTFQVSTVDQLWIGCALFKSPSVAFPETEDAHDNRILGLNIISQRRMLMDSPAGVLYVQPLPSDVSGSRRFPRR